MKLVESSAPAAQPVGFSPSVQQHKSSSIPVSSHSQSKCMENFLVAKVKITKVLNLFVAGGGSTIPIPVGYQELDNESFACNWYVFGCNL